MWSIGVFQVDLFRHESHEDGYKYADSGLGERNDNPRAWRTYVACDICCAAHVATVCRHLPQEHYTRPLPIHSALAACSSCPET